MSGHSFIAEAQAPANIALIKYWGKADEKRQWPANDSVSMTLSEAVTKTRVTLSPASSWTYEVRMNGRRLAPDAPGFQRVKLHVERCFAALAAKKITPDRPYGVLIITDNSFPSGCGIASSASGMAALTLALAGGLLAARSLADLERRGVSPEMLAHLARMGSGSAGRSMLGGYVKWEKGGHPDEQRITPLFAPRHWALADTICVIDDQPKSLSSSEAHRLVWKSDFFREHRLRAMETRLQGCEEALRKRDFKALAEIVETEALEIHKVIEEARAGFSYLTKQSRVLLEFVRYLRRERGLSACFSIDAGPNLHVLSPLAERAAVREALRGHPAIKFFIEDQVGEGPTYVGREAVAA